MAKRSRKNIDRVIAIVASLVLALGLVPVTASAAGEGPDGTGGQAPNISKTVAAAGPEAPPAPTEETGDDAAGGGKAEEGGAKDGAGASGEDPGETGDAKADTPADGDGENAPGAAPADDVAAGGGKAEAPAEGAAEGAPGAAPADAGGDEGKGGPAGQADDPGKAAGPEPAAPAAEDSGAAANVQAAQAAAQAGGAAAGAKAQLPAFRQSRTVGGVTVTVEADAGAFPADAVLSVEAAPSSATEEAVAAERDADQNVAASYTFDVKVLGADGAELQPTDGKAVRVSFAAAEVADPNLDAHVYHVADGEGAAEELPVSESGDTATATSDGFSYYTVEFTYDNLEYVLPGGESIPLADILAAVGLEGEPTSVEVSDPELFSASDETGAWVVTSHRAFSSTEWMKVTLNNVVYEITVTDEWDQGFNFNDIGNGEAEITYYTGSDENVVIPETVTDSIGIEYTVTSIGDNAFSDNDTIKSVQIPSGVTSIGDHAFMDCDSLQSIEIPSGVTSIGDRAFYNCESLQSVTFAGNKLTSIGDRAFYSCDALTSVTIPASVTSIGAYAFYDCSNLQSVTFVGESALTSIGESAFEDCSNLQSVTIGNGVTSIGKNAFYCCSALESITIGNNVNDIGETAFIECASLNAVHISNLTKWCGISFYGPSSNPLFYAHHLYLNGVELTELTIPSDVTSIGKYAFYECTGLTSVTIPASVTTIGNYAFFNCTGLEDVYYSGTASDWNSLLGNNTGLPSSEDSPPPAIHFVTDSGTCGPNLTWTLYNDGTLTITGTGNMDNFVNFYSAPWYNERGSIKAVIIDDGVTSIGDYAFYGSGNIGSVTIGNSVETIGASAFSNSRSFTSITIPGSVKSIGEMAFNACTDLTSVSIPDSVTSIGAGAFSNSGLTSITIPGSVTSISNYTFSNCGNLASVEIPDSVTSIGNKAFLYCSSLTSVEIPDSVESIGVDAFYGMTRLTSITIPDSVTSIGEEAFSDSGLTSITIPGSVTSISNYTFSNCGNLASVEIPGSVTSIGNKAFFECSNLKDVYYCGTRDQWEDSSFTKGYEWDTGTPDNKTIHYLYAVTSSASPDGCGQVTVTPSLDAPTSLNEGLFWSETNVAVKATPVEGYYFDKWTTTSDDVAFAGETDAETTFVMPAHEVTVTANFKEKAKIDVMVNRDGQSQDGLAGYLRLVTADGADTGVVFERSLADGEYIYVYDPATTTGSQLSSGNYVLWFDPPASSGYTASSTELGYYENVYQEITTFAYYTVEFVNWDGTVLQSGAYKAGEQPKYTGDEPTRPATAQCEYTFSGWDPGVVAVAGKAIYKATFTETAKKGVYEVVSGAGGTWEEGSGDPLVFTFERTVNPETAFGHFAGIEVDSKAVSEKDASGKTNYTAKRGSVIVALQPSFLATLSEGNHTVTALFDDGNNVDVAFTLAAGPAPAVKHTVTFDANGHGKAPDAQEVEHGKTAARPADPTASGYTFGGWYADKACKDAYDFSAPVTEDVTLYAKWTAVHTVTFDRNGHGTAPDAQEVVHGEKAKRPKDPTADGYTFGGWYTDKACTKAYDFKTPVTGDVTLYAKWTKKSSSSSSTSPKTGDPLGGALAIALALAAASALALAASRRRRRG